MEEEKKDEQELSTLMQEINEISEQHRDAAGKKPDAGKESEESKKEEPETKPPVEPGKDGFDFKFFGDGYDTKEKVKEALGSVSTFKQEKSDWETKETTWGTEKGEYEKKLKEHKSKIDDPTLFRLNHVKKNNPDHFDLYKNMVFSDKIDSLNAMIKKYVKENPAYKDEYEKAKRFIINDYGLNRRIPQALVVDEDKEITQEMVSQREDEIKEAKEKLDFAQMKLDSDAGKYRNGLLEEFNKIELPTAPEEKTQQEKEAVITQLKEDWSPYVEEMAKVVPKISVPYGDKSLTYTIPEEIKSELKLGLAEYLVKNKMPLTKESVKLAHNFYVAKAMVMEQSNINRDLMQEGRNLSDEEWDILTTNSSARKPSSAEPSKGGSDKHQEMTQKLNEMFPD